MKIYLNDIEKNNKDVKVDIAVEYSVPAQDLILIFYSKNQTCGLLNGSESSPYDHYDFRKVAYILEGSFEYEEKEYSVKIAFYTSKGNLVPYLISAESDESGIRFSSSHLYDDNFHSDFKLIDYKEFQLFSELFNRPGYSFKNFISDTLNGKINEHHYSLFNVFPKEKNDIKDFISYKGFELFLDEEEKRTDKVRN